MIPRIQETTWNQHYPRNTYDREDQLHLHPASAHTKPTASSCCLGQLENEYIQEGRDKDLPLDCLHFPISPHFTERFRQMSRYFFALADCPNGYLNTFFTRDTAPYKIYAKYDPFYLQFGFLHPTQRDVNNTTHKVNRVKMRHTMHNYLFVQLHFQHTNPIIHINSRFILSPLHSILRLLAPS